MKDDLNILKMKDNLNYFENAFDLNFLKMIDNLFLSEEDSKKL